MTSSTGAHYKDHGTSPRWGWPAGIACGVLLTLSAVAMFHSFSSHLAPNEQSLSTHRYGQHGQHGTKDTSTIGALQGTGNGQPLTCPAECPAARHNHSVHGGTGAGTTVSSVGKRTLQHGHHTASSSHGSNPAHADSDSHAEQGQTMHMYVPHDESVSARSSSQQQHRHRGRARALQQQATAGGASGAVGAAASGAASNATTGGMDGRAGSGGEALVAEAAREAWVSEAWATALPLKGDLSRNEAAAAYMAALAAVQTRWGVGGGVAEIGVHHGMFFLSMATLARKGEPLFVLDLFQAGQGRNEDKSGNGDEGVLMHNLKALGVSASDIEVYTGASTDVSQGQLCGLLKGQPLRLLSIDGGHTRATVMHDLSLAECVLADGGIAMMDDFSNHFWPGVMEAVVTYFNQHSGTTRLAPFLLAANKLYITTANYHAQYLAETTSWPYWHEACRWDGFYWSGKKWCMQAPGVPSHEAAPAAKFTLLGWGIAIAEYPTVYDPIMTRQLWANATRTTHLHL